VVAPWIFENMASIRRQLDFIAEFLSGGRKCAGLVACGGRDEENSFGHPNQVRSLK
jgi:hypothetical protein